MGYVIYDVKTTRIVSKAYKTHAAARAQLTRMSLEWWDTEYKPGYPETIRDADPVYQNGIAEEEYFRKNIEKRRMVVNMMTGVETTEPVNTPNYMSVGSEAYWSM